MGPECACAPPRRARAAAPWLGLASGLAALVGPKCPLCVAAWLSVLGIGLGAAQSLAALLPALGATLCAVALSALWLRKSPKIASNFRGREPASKKLG